MQAGPDLAPPGTAHRVQCGAITAACMHAGQHGLLLELPHMMRHNAVTAACMHALQQPQPAWPLACRLPGSAPPAMHEWKASAAPGLQHGLVQAQALQLLLQLPRALLALRQLLLLPLPELALCPSVRPSVTCKLVSNMPTSCSRLCLLVPHGKAHATCMGMFFAVSNAQSDEVSNVAACTVPLALQGGGICCMHLFFSRSAATLSVSRRSLSSELLASFTTGGCCLICIGGGAGGSATMGGMRESTIAAAELASQSPLVPAAARGGV